MKPPYKPLPGTIPHKAMVLFEELPPDTQLSNVELAEKIGYDFPDSLSTCLKPLVNAGILKKDYISRNRSRIAVWMKGNGIPLIVARDQPLQSLPYPPPDPALRSIFEMGLSGQQVNSPDPTAAMQSQQPIGEQPQEPPRPATPPVARPFSCCSISDGSFLISSGYHVVHLSPEDADKLQLFIASRQLSVKPSAKE